MDEEENLKQSLLKGSPRSNRPSSTGASTGAGASAGAGGNDADTFDTFETIAYNYAPLRGQASRAPSAPGRFSGVGNLTGLGDSTGSGKVSSSGTACASPLAPTSSGPVGPGGYSGGVANKNRLGRSATYCPSQAFSMNRADSTTDEVVLAYKQKYARMDMKQVSFMTRFRNTAYQMNREPSARVDSATVIKMDGSQSGEMSPTKNASLAQAPSAISELSQPQMIHGAMGSAFVNVNSRARVLKKKDHKFGYFALARLIFEITFTATAALAAIAVSTHDQHVHKVSRAWGVPWLSWLILAALLCPAVRVGDRAVDAVVKGLEFTATRLHLENVHYTLIGLSDALKLVASTLLLETLVLIIMKEHNDSNTQDDDTHKFIKKTSLCIVVFAFVDLAKTLGCRLLSLRVNAESLFDLLKTTIEKEHILNKLMTQSRVATTRGAGTLTGGVTESERLEAIAKLRDIPEWSVEQYLDNLYELSLPVDEDVVSSFTDRITDLVTQFRNMPEAQLDEHATCAAEFCWLTVAPAADISSDRMYKADLAVLLKNDAETEFAFSLFDLDGDGYVTEPEVHSRIQGMYRERRNLARTLQDNDDVIHTLEMLIGCVMHVVAIVPYLLIFGQDIERLLFSLSSISVASAFVFGNSLKTIYESVVFLFVIRPYQVGDAIIYKDALHVVKNFGLLNTQFLRFDGCKIWVPNEKLMQSDILNVTHSRNLTDRLTFEVDVLTMTPELCDDLAKRVVEMQEREEPRRLFNNDITPGSYILGVSNPLKYSVCLTYQLAFNGAKFARVAEARTLVNHVIGQWLVDHELSHSTSVQPLYNYTPCSHAKASGKTS